MKNSSARKKGRMQRGSEAKEINVLVSLLDRGVMSNDMDMDMNASSEGGRDEKEGVPLSEVQNVNAFAFCSVLYLVKRAQREGDRQREDATGM